MLRYVLDKIFTLFAILFIVFARNNEILKDHRKENKRNKKRAKKINKLNYAILIIYFKLYLFETLCLYLHLNQFAHNNIVNYLY